VPDTALSATSSFTPTWSPSTSTSTSAKSPGDMSKDDFLKLLVSQLKYQNPLSPTDPTSFMQQSTQLATMERLSELAKVTDRLLTTEQTRSAAGLLGQTVTWTTGEGDAATESSGVVGSVRLGGDEPLLVVGTNEIALSHVVRLSPTATSTPAPTPAAQTPEES
jgi:flagellar basal-body rod modification protein FlgD